MASCVFPSDTMSFVRIVLWKIEKYKCKSTSLHSLFFNFKGMCPFIEMTEKKIALFFSFLVEAVLLVEPCSSYALRMSLLKE